MSARTPALVTARERHCVLKILDRVILLPCTTRRLPPVHDLPSQDIHPNGGITQQLTLLRPFP